MWATILKVAIKMFKAVILPKLITRYFSKVTIATPPKETKYTSGEKRNTMEYREDS